MTPNQHKNHIYGGGHSHNQICAYSPKSEIIGVGVGVGWGVQVGFSMTQEEEERDNNKCQKK